MPYSREEKWIARWKESKIFQPFPNPDKKKFFLTVPYAYPTGPLHVGHGRTYTNGDVMARFHRIKGENVWWPMGFHVTGTPVLAVSDAIKRGDEDTRRLYREYLSIYEKDAQRVETLLASFANPQNVADYFSAHISDDLDKIGASIDWRSSFTTMELEYQKFVQWQFRKLFEKKALVKGKYPILYSIADKNAVGEDDIRDGDVDKVSVQSYELVKFPFEDCFFVASTLRPETLFGVTNLWVNPKIEYVKVYVDGESWIIAQQSVEKLAQQGKKILNAKKIDISLYIHKRAEHPLNSGEKIPVLPSSFVSAERGTGIVYSVPGHAPWDFAALKDIQEKDSQTRGIEVKYIIHSPDFPRMDEWFVQQKNPTLNHKDALQRMTEEVYKKEFYEGIMSPGNASLSGMKVKDAGGKMIQLLKKQHRHDVVYEPSRRAVTRSGNPVSVAVLDDQWFLDYSSPEWKKKTHALLDSMTVYPSHFKKAISDAIDWLEKRPCIRKRGLGTPFPFDENWMIEPLSDSTMYMVFYVLIPHLRSMRINSADLDDAFFDHAILGKKLASNDTRFAIAERANKDLEYWYPNDVRHTAPAHISNHISFFLFTHTLLLKEKYWPKSLTFNEMLVRNGIKMSKSKGNVIPLQHGVKEYGADLLRLFTISSAGFERVADWRDNQVPQVKKKLEEMEVILRSAATSTNTMHSPETEWLVEILRKRLGEGYDAYEKMEFMSASQKIFFEMLNEIKRFRKVFGLDESPAIKHVLDEWIILISPITPFLAEEMWEIAHHSGDLTKKYAVDVENEKVYVNDISFASMQSLKRPDGSPSDEMTQRVEFIEKVLGDMEHVKKMLKGKKPIAAYVYSVEAKETAWLNASREQLAKYAQVEIKINDAHDPLNKKQRAQKGKPALYFE
ncbi:MAG: leucine--tRNA ligase [Candidatus Diapherotrites archaeon]